MAITQTVEVPADRRIILEVPHDVPTGSVILTFTPREVPAAVEQPKERVSATLKGNTVPIYLSIASA